MINPQFNNTITSVELKRPEDVAVATVEVDYTFFEQALVTAVNQRNIAVEWYLLPTNIDLTLVTYRVYRALDALGPYIHLADVPAQQFYYLDNNTPVLSKWHTLHYVIEAVAPGGTHISPPAIMEPPPPGRVLAINEQARIVYRSANGSPLLVFKRRGDGKACTVCWDPVQGIARDEDCPLCFGTGRIQPYYMPVHTRGLIVPEPQKQIEFQSHQHEPAQVEMHLLRYPRVQPKDVIYEENRARWWYVGIVSPLEDRRVLVGQSLSLRQADPQDKTLDLLSSKLAQYLLLPVV